MSNHLFLFTIGPVQSFIAQARKTQDLYAGSKLLSDLINVAIEFVGKEKIIFPDSDIEHKPNRFIAEVTSDNPMQLGKDTEARVKSQLISEAKKYLPNYENILGIEEQINNFLQIYWVMTSYNNPEEYNAKFAELESLLGSVKNARGFQQINYQENGYGEIGRKCAVNGEYNIKYYRLTDSDYNPAKRRIRNQKRDNSYNPSIEEIKPDICKNKLFTQNSAEVHIIGENEIDKISLSQMQPGEGLCAISMLKRLYKKDSIESFPSTAGICLMHKLHEWRNSNHINFRTIDKYENLIKNKNVLGYFDEQLYFIENATSEKYLKSVGIINSGIIKSITTLYKEEIKDLIDNEKDKYYAVIVFDGDSMGKWLSGDKEFVNIGIDLKKFHNDLSESLGEFAKACSKYLNAPKGKSVYAGGDDFLGFVNLSYLFEVLEEFQKLFTNKVNQPLKNYFQDNQKMSFSAGIAVAHYKIPLSEVINSARAMEVEAKGIHESKNAFAITVLKHSGERQSFKLPWKDLMGNSNLSSIQAITDSLKSEKFSNTYIQSIVREFGRLLSNDEAKQNRNSALYGLIHVEINRLIDRACNLKENKQEEVFKLSETTNTIYQLNSVNLKEPSNFFSILTNSDFIRKHINIIDKDN